MLALAVGLAYAGTLNSPFVYDDIINIVRNSTIRDLWPPVIVMPPDLAGYTVDGRPFLNFTFAVNYALGGLDPAGYHLFNIAVHFLAAAVFFDLLFRTLTSDRLKTSFGESARTISLAAALIFAVHPMATNAVTYISQRAESLAALFYVSTIYFLALGAGNGGGRKWLAASLASLVLGMSTKEIMATAPLAALLYDRTFISGGFGEAVKKRRGYYSLMALSYVVLILLMSMSGTRSGTVGTTEEIGCLGNFAVQTMVVVKYLKLALWPSPLTLSYAWIPVPSFAEFMPYALLLAAVGAAALYGAVKNAPAAYPAILFFLYLAPTSSFIPINIQAAEYRMYLPLMCLSALVCSTLVYAAGKLPGKSRGAALLLFAAVFALYASMAVARNRDYATALSIWRDAVEKQPRDYAAMNNYGIELMNAGDYAEAEKVFAKGLEEDPGNMKIAISLGNLYAKTGRSEDAGRVFEAVSATGGDGKKKIYGSLARLALEAGRTAEAENYARLAISQNPNSDEGYGLAGQTALASGRYGEAVGYYREALRLNPDEKAYYLNIGLAHLLSGENAEARKYFAALLERDGGNALALSGMGNAYFFEKNYGEAVKYYEKSLASNPDQPETANFLSIARAALQRGAK